MTVMMVKATMSEQNREQQIESGSAETIVVIPASEEHLPLAGTICTMIADAAAKRGTGIARRTPEYIAAKMREGKGVIALDRSKQGEAQVAGFCYIESWSHDRFVANSGLIVSEDYRKSGLARRIKQRIFALSRERYPDARIFSITTSLAVMKLNSDLGYRPVTFSELTDDDAFWKGCKSCPNIDILERNERRMCLCTGMLYHATEDVAQADSTAASDPDLTDPENIATSFPFDRKVGVLERLRRIKRALFLGSGVEGSRAKDGKEQSTTKAGEKKSE